MAGWKNRDCIVELDTHQVALPDRQRRGDFVSVAMREVEDAIAYTQRFAGRVYIAYSSHHVPNRPVGGDVERNDRRTEDLDRGFERRRVEDQRARVVFTLIAGLIVFTTERNPPSSTFTDRLR